MVTWTYTISNPGNVALSNIAVTDNKGVTPVYQSGDTNNNKKLDTNETWIYTATGTAVAGLYTNIGTAKGTPPYGYPVSDSNPDGYYGTQTAKIKIVKTTNGTNNDCGYGPSIQVGSPVTWTYTITNPGLVSLSNIKVTDNKGVTPVYQSGDTNNDGNLDTSETWIYTASGAAVAGHYTNIGTATGTPANGNPVSSTNSDSYFGIKSGTPSGKAGIKILKTTNDTNNDCAPGRSIAVGSPVTWTYTITNNGNVPLSNISVTDDKGVTPVYQSGDTNNNDKLDTREIWIYKATGMAIAGQYTNVGTATGTPAVGNPVSASNPDHYYGIKPNNPCEKTGIKIVKTTNGTNNDCAPGRSIAVGSLVTWTYTVTNTGNTVLSNIIVTDNQGLTPVYQGGDINNDGKLDTRETWVYKATGTAVAGQYTNVGTATGTQAGKTVTSYDKDHYYGVTSNPPCTKSGIKIVKTTNGSNNDCAPGLSIAVGSAVTWTYTVTNTGNVPLSNITVTDNKGVTPVYQSGDSDNNGKLDIHESWIYQASGTAVAGQYTNIGTAKGTPPTGNLVSASNPDNYFGKSACLATRTIGFWETHTDFTGKVFAKYFPNGMYIGSGDHKDCITNITQSDRSRLFGAFFASIPCQDGSNEKRSQLDQARIQMLQQLVAAKLNCAATGALPVDPNLFSNANDAYGRDNVARIINLTSQLDTYNCSGDKLQLPSSLGYQGSATPKTSQYFADLGFWDRP